MRPPGLPGREGRRPPGSISSTRTSSPTTAAVPAGRRTRDPKSRPPRAQWNRDSGSPRGPGGITTVAPLRPIRTTVPDRFIGRMLTGKDGGEVGFGPVSGSRGAPGCARRTPTFPGSAHAGAAQPRTGVDPDGTYGWNAGLQTGTHAAPSRTSHGPDGLAPTHRPGFRRATFLEPCRERWGASYPCPRE